MHYLNHQGERQSTQRCRLWTLVSNGLVLVLIWAALSWNRSINDVKAAEVENSLQNSVGMQFVRIPDGEFLMGEPAPLDEPRSRGWKDGRMSWKDKSRPQHLVKITQPYFLQTTEVTQQQWYSVMRTQPWREVSERMKQYYRKINVDPSATLPKHGPNYPATMMSWYEAIDFCKRLSRKEGIVYRLPTEAEWEYACRAGTATSFSFGEDGTPHADFAWIHEGNKLPKQSSISKQTYFQVAQKAPNPWGLYDMHGNIWELCQDWYAVDYYLKSPTNDPVGPLSGERRVARGGCWALETMHATSSSRLSQGPEYKDRSFGFRVVREVSNSDNQLETITNSPLGFTLNLPVGFTKRPELLESVTDLDVVLGYQYDGLKRSEAPPILLVARSMKTKSVTDIPKKDKDHNGDRFFVVWQGIDLEIKRALSSRWSKEEITYTAELPLSESTVQVILSGQFDQQDNIQPLFLKVLDGFHGEINWYRTLTPGWLAYSEYYWLIVSFAAYAVVLVSSVVIHALRRRHVHVAELLIAAVAFMLIWQFHKVQIRELVLFSILLFLAGIGGTILGIGYLFLQRNSKTKFRNEPSTRS